MSLDIVHRMTQPYKLATTAPIAPWSLWQRLDYGRLRPTARGQTTPTFFDIDSVGGSSFTDLQQPQNTHIEAVKMTFRLASYVAKSGTKEFRINKTCPTLLCFVPWATICLCLFSFLSSMSITIRNLSLYVYIPVEWIHSMFLFNRSRWNAKFWYRIYDSKITLIIMTQWWSFSKRVSLQVQFRMHSMNKFTRPNTGTGTSRYRLVRTS